MNNEKKNAAEESVAKVVGMIKAKIQNELPEAEYPNPVTTTCKIPLKCGAVLDCALYLPQKEGAFPTVIIRNPYYGDGTNSAFFGTFSEHGYAAIFVSVRGTLDSTGDWLPFEHEMEDGVEVIDWVASQPWCDGNVATYGGSYLGHTQWSVASCGHPALKTCFISVYGPFGYDLFYRRGMFRQNIWTIWAAKMMGENRRRADFTPEFLQKSLSFRPQTKLGEELISETCEWYNMWNGNTKRDDAYWADGFWGEFQTVPSKIKIPVMLQGGWFDIFIRPQMKGWRELPEETRAKSRFVIGPWDHGDAFTESFFGKPMYPDGDILGSFQFKAAIEWFDYQIKGKPYPHELGVMETYSIHDNQWLRWNDDIKASGTKEFYLDAKALSLLAKVPDSPASVSYTYDPKDPVTSIAESSADALLAVPGLKENKIHQRKPGDRDDVISFISEPLAEDMKITGSIQAEIYVSSSAIATAFMVSIMELCEDGESDMIRSDIADIRSLDENCWEDYTPGKIVKLNFNTIDVTWCVKKNSRLRVDISSSSFPEYHVHPNKTECWAELTDSITAKQTVYSGAQHQSKILIPVLEG